MGDSPTAWAAPTRQNTSRGRGSESAPSHVSGSGTTLTHPSAGASSSAWKISHSRATLQNWPHPEVSNSSNAPTPKSGEQFAPLHWISERESGGSVGKYMRENASRSPLPCSAIWCWETTLMMLSQSLGSRLREKTPHSRMFKKIVQREAGGRNVSGSGVQFACRSALGDHERFPTPEEDAPLLMEFPTPQTNSPLL